MSAWTYLLLSEHGDVYLGATTRIRKRLREHNGPEKGHHTSGKKWRLLAVRRFDSRKEAFDFQSHLKRKRRDQKIIWERRLGPGKLHARLYGIEYQLDLFSNFTYETDPIDGDRDDIAPVGRRLSATSIFIRPSPARCAPR